MQVDRTFKLSLEHDTWQYEKENSIPLVFTCNFSFRNLSTVLRNNFNILYSDAEVRKVFTPSSCVAYRSARNLKVRSKDYPFERTVGSSKCGSKWWQVCLNVSETDVSESFQTKRQYKINHHLSCNDKCLIYLPVLRLVGCRL